MQKKTGVFRGVFKPIKEERALGTFRIRIGLNLNF